MALRNGKKTAGARKIMKKPTKPTQKKQKWKPPTAKSPKGAKGGKNAPLTPNQRKRFEEIGKITPIRVKKWTYEREAELCRLWEEEDSLYNARNKDYREPDRRSASFERIAAILKMDPVDVETHAKSLRTAYTKLTSPEPSGSSPSTLKVTKRQREILKLCSFLADHIKNRESVSNLDEEIARNEGRRRSPRLAGRDHKDPKKKRFVQTAAAAQAARDAEAAAERQATKDGKKGEGRKLPKKGYAVKGRQAPKVGPSQEKPGKQKIHTKEASEQEKSERQDGQSGDDEQYENDYYEHEFESDAGYNNQQQENHEGDHEGDGDDGNKDLNSDIDDQESESEIQEKHPKANGKPKGRKRRVHELSDLDDMEFLDENPIPPKKGAKRDQDAGKKDPPEFYVSSLKRRTSESKNKEQLAYIMDSRTQFLKSLTTSIENIADSTENTKERIVPDRDNYDFWASILASRIREMDLPIGARFMLYIDKLAIDVMEGEWKPPK